MSAYGRRAPIAHRRADDGAVHDLAEHLETTARLAAGFADAWGGGEGAALMGLWHDLGKYAREFQAMIRGADPEAHLEGVPAGPRPRVNHSSAGAQWAVERLGPFGRLLAYGIAGHHAGLPDWLGEGARRGLADRLRDTTHLARVRAAGPPAEILERAAPTAGLPVGADPSLWARMLASALFDADFLDSEAFFDRGKARQRRRPWRPLAGLCQRLDDHMDAAFGAPARTPVNALRAEVLAACRAAAERPQGLFSLTVPTGGAKTLSSLAFALRHARRHHLDRVIYAVPFTSIIEQTAEVFRDALGSDAVLEHHSALGPRAEAETARSRLAAENWDAPVIVTTTVQLFDSLFASRTSRVRKLHNLARSVLVLDEAQALPTTVLRPVTAVIDQLGRHYGVSIVLCTATQPALGAVFRGLAPPTEIAPEPERLFATLERVTVALPAAGRGLDWEEVAVAIDEERQALAIVNTRHDCRALYALLPGHAIHLSTWQCAAHRAQLLARIKRRLAAGEPVRVVSTSLIEAGVDIDFPAVFRALTGLDSLAQAAGRCNREGRLARGRFVVFRPRSSTPSRHVAQAIEAAEAALRGHRGAPFRPAAFADYFRELYWSKGEAALDHYGMATLLGLGGIRREGHPFDLSFRTAAERFRMIDEAQETIVVSYDAEAEAAIARLRREGAGREILRALQRFTVPLRRPAFDRLRAIGALEDVDGTAILVAPELYRDDVGLDQTALPTLIA